MRAIPNLAPTSVAIDERDLNAGNVCHDTSATPEARS
jgi:hypothetical protein